MLAILPVLALLTPLQVSTGAPGQASQSARRRQPNIVLIIADDFGVDLVGAYGEGVAPACTPNIDELAAEGMLFRNAWVNPTCTPTRAALLTGRYGFRTGIGEVPPQGSPGLPLAEITIPEVLTGYTSALAGKWHLAGNLGNLHPNESGFAQFAGAIRGAVQDYFQWTKVTNGQVSTSTTYATSDTTDEAIAAIQGLPEPWFTCVSYNAPHAPNHAPPASLCPGLSCTSSFCANLPANPSTPEYVKAMSEAMDSEIGRLIAALDAVDPEAWVFFMGDNGTARMASEAPFLAGHAKGSVFEGGVNVPFIVRGPGVVSAECAALVSGVDLLATFAELAGVSAPRTDSVSMVECFADPSVAPRETVYAESFSPNFGVLPFPEHDRAIRNARYKLIRRTGDTDSFYDLLFDPFETANLLSTLNAQEQTAHDALLAELVALGVD